MAAPVIQFKRGIFSNLPGLRAGEPGFTTDKYDLYVGIDSTTNGNKFFGSHRYWTKETTTAGSGVNLVEGTNNGTNSVTLKAPASITSDVTYTFPGAAVDQGYLRTNSSGVLSWESGVNATGVSTIAFLQATTVNVSAAATIPTLSGTTATFTNITANGGFTGNINAAGVSTVGSLQATTVNASGIVTASSLRAADLRTTGGALIPLVGIQSAGAATGIVTAFKFVGTGLDGFTVANNVATISYSGVAATTYTTSQTATATQGQTAFTFSAGYSQGFVDVYLNGIRLITGTDYTATDGSTVTLTSGATAGDEIEMVGWKSLGSVVAVNALQTTGSLNVSGITTSTGGFTGNINASGVSTASFLQATTVNASGIVTASSFSGSGAGLSAGTTPISTLDIDGATAATAVTADDLLIIDDGANGTNKKVTAQVLSNFILGGAGGATFPSINVTGIGTVSQLNATTSVVGAGLTVNGATDLNGGLDVSGGETVLSSATVSDLTSGRIVTAGASGALQDSANLTFGANGLRVTESVNVSGIITASAVFSGNLHATGVSTAAFLQATTVNASGIVTALSFSGSGSGLSAGTVPASAIDIDGAIAAAGLTSDDLFLIDDGAGGTNKKLTAQQLSNYVLGGSGGATFPAINVTGIATATFLQATTATVGAGLTVTGATDLNGGLDVSGGETVLSSATVSDLTSGRVVLAGTSGALQDNANLTFNGSTLAVTGSQTVSTNLTVSGGISGNINATGVSTVTTVSGTTATFTNITANGGFTGNINATGVSTAGFLQATTVNASGIVTASQFSGSGAGLSNSTVPVPSLNITGAGASTSVAASDVFVFQSAATGVNGKVSAQNLSNYILGGSGGATFPAINVTGIATATFLKATTATVGAGLTVTGAITGNGGASITGGETTLSSATVSDLTAGRVVLAGTSGALEDSSNLTFGANGLRVTGGANVSAASTFGSNLSVGGNVIVSGDLTVNGTTTQINTIQTTIEDTLLELQIVDGTAPSSDTNKDVGLIMNYYDTQARKAAFFWDDSATRFVLAATASESTGVVTPATYGGLEIGSLYLNDCAGASQVISCSGTTRSLENITIDGGSF
jgi:hypothetical protein